MTTTISSTTSGTTSSTTSSTSSSSSDTSDTSSSSSSTGAAILSSAGLSSGLDVDSIVTALVDAKQSGESTQISTKTTALQAQQTAYTTLTSALNSLQSALSTLTTTSTFSAYTATLGNSSVGTATTMSDAQAGSYSLVVSSLATAQKRSSDSYTSGAEPGAGTLDITVGSDSMSLSVSATDSLSTIASAINAASDNPGVTASVVNTGSGTQQLLLSSSSTGVDNAYTITASSDSSDGLSALATKLNTADTDSTEATDASLSIDGIAVTSASNAVSGVLDGVTINLTGTGSSSLTVTRDTSAASTAIDAFVTAYNDYETTAASLSSYDADTETAGTLLGDSTLSSLQRQISSVMGSVVSGNTLKSLAVLGITRDSTGQLTVDDDTLSSALSSNPSAVQDLFAGTNGYATKLSDVIGDFTDDGGIIPTKQTSITNQLSSLSDETTKLNARMAVYEAQLRSQYTALDTLMSSLNSTSSYLTTALKALESSSSDSDS